MRFRGYCIGWNPKQKGPVFSQKIASGVWAPPPLTEHSAKICTFLRRPLYGAIKGYDGL